MTTGNRLPSQAREIAELKAEIRKLWAALARRPDWPVMQEEKTFSWANEVSGTKTSGIWWAPSDLTITSGVGGYAVESSASTTIQLRVGGVTQHSFTLDAGDDRSSELVAVRVGYGQAVQVNVAAGSGDGEDFTFTLGFVRAAGPR